MKVIHWIALIIVVIGALNAGLWGLFQIDLVASTFEGPSSVISRIIYTIFGLAGIWMFSFFKILASCPICKKGNH